MVAHNCAHAVSYSYISYYTAYLKFYYPTEYMCAVLSSEKNDDSLLDYKQHTKDLGITITPPSIASPSLSYEVVDDKTIATGLLAIKGIGEKAITHILENQPYTSFPDFIYKSIGNKEKRSPITKTIIENLAKAGCFDIFGVSRKNALEHWSDVKDKITATIKKSAKDNIPLDFNDSMISFEDGEYSKKQILQNEMEVMGHYLTGSHNDIYGGFFKNSPDIISLASIDKYEGGQLVKVEAVIKTKIKELTIKKKGPQFGKLFAKYLIEDVNGKTAEITLWPAQYEKFRNVMEPGIPFRAVCEINSYLDSKSLVLKSVESMPGVIQGGKLIV